MRIICLIAAVGLFAPPIGDARAQRPKIIETQAAAEQPADPKKFGADANSTGDPIGGGAQYRDMINPPAKTIATREEFLESIRTAAKGSLLYIDDDAEIDLTGTRDIEIPAGVTLASGRGRNGSPGALIFTTEDKKTTEPEVFSLLQANAGVRITGLRIQGPDPARRQPTYAFLVARGVTTSSNIEVDNCELSGWSHAAIYLRHGKSYIHHNFIHHCRRHGLGYGVCLDRAEALIEANKFNLCRHAIAGTGRRGCCYEARFNLVQRESMSHNFDMHGGKDRGDRTYLAGDWVRIHHNTFQSGIAVGIRGVPASLSEVHHNWFVNRQPGKAVVQYNRRGNLRVFENAYGAKKVVHNVGGR